MPRCWSGRSEPVVTVDSTSGPTPTIWHRRAPDSTGTICSCRSGSEEYRTATQTNRSILGTKSRLVGWIVIAVYVEGLSLAVSAGIRPWPLITPTLGSILGLEISWWRRWVRSKDDDIGSAGWRQLWVAIPLPPFDTTRAFMSPQYPVFPSLKRLAFTTGQSWSAAGRRDGMDRPRRDDRQAGYSTVAVTRW